MTIPFHIEQLCFVVDVASYRTPFLDPLFRMLNYVDSPYFGFLLVPLIWIGFSYRWGLRLFYLMVITMMMNSFFKELVEWPRPCTDLPEVGMFCPRSFGFPSGGAQMSFLLGGLFISAWRTPIAWVLGIAYILLLSFSRIYLGVHYPIDILGGWVLGLVVLVLYLVSIDPLERLLKKKGLLFSFMLGFIPPLLLTLFVTSSKYQRFDALIIAVGACLSLKYKLYLRAPKNLGEGLGGGLIAVGGVVLLLLLLPHTLPISLVSAAIALWVSLLASPLCKWLLKI